jgi:hypothetical protein
MNILVIKEKGRCLHARYSGGDGASINGFRQTNRLLVARCCFSAIAAVLALLHSIPLKWQTCHHANSNLHLTHVLLAALLQVIETDARVAEIHANAEVFDRKAELSFKYLQVCLTAGVSIIIPQVQCTQCHSDVVHDTEPRCTPLLLLRHPA